jgi:hypothetical protein
MSVLTLNCEPAPNSVPHRPRRKMLISRVYWLKEWGHDWNPIMTLQAGTFPRSFSGLSDLSGGFKIVSRFTPWATQRDTVYIKSRYHLETHP